MRKLLIICLVLIGFVGCSTGARSVKPTVTVSIAPLGYLVERLADTLVDVRVLVPETTSPETYEPTVRQIGGLANSDFYFAVGLIDFEQALRSKIESVAPNTKYINLSEGMEVMAGVCSHGVEGHSHGVDPHVWLSPRLMGVMAEGVARELVAKYPSWSSVILRNLLVLQGEIMVLDIFIENSIRVNNIKSFGIVHPSLTYFARDYGLEQIEIEQQGKEPSAGVVRGLVDRMRGAGISKILYSRQSSSAGASTVAGELGIPIVEYDPLRGDWMENMYHLNGLLCD